MKELIERYQKVPVSEYNNQVNKEHLVSICVQTYQHANYIKDCLDGILMQKTTFPFEILLGEDESTDGTREICIEYAQKYPDKIQLFLHHRENNIKINGSPTGRFNFLYNLQSARGKYIALCEGDDYWTDPLKLQKQVDFLEANEDYGMVCTNYDKYYQVNHKTKKDIFKKYKDEVHYDDYLLDRSSIGTQTVLIRNTIINNYFQEIGKKIIISWNVGDTGLWLYTSIKSRIKVFQESTAVYRILDSSACHFENPEQHLAFVRKGMEIPLFFIENFGAKESTKNIFAKKLITIDLIHAYKTSNFKLAKEVRHKLIEINSYKLKDKLLLIGSIGPFWKYLVEKVFIIYRFYKN